MVGVGAEGAFAHAGEEFAEGGVAGQAGAQREGVDEESDERFGLGAGPAGDRGADDDVLTAGVAAEEELVGGQQDHERGRTFGAGELLETIGGRAGQRAGDERAGAGGAGGARVVGRELQQRGRAGQLLLPVGALFDQGAGGHVLLLPERVVAVLDVQRRQGSARR